jgi:hypothetical protein
LSEINVPTAWPRHNGFALAGATSAAPHVAKFEGGVQFGSIIARSVVTV